MKRYIKAYITQPEEDAWALIDKYMKREWGEVQYNESARAILVMEMPFNGISEDGENYSEGTCAAVVNLKDHELYYRVFIPEGDGIAEDDWEKVIKYESLDDMIVKLLKPMADGKITEQDFYEKCENYYY